MAKGEKKKVVKSIKNLDKLRLSVLLVDIAKNPDLYPSTISEWLNVLNSEKEIKNIKDFRIKEQSQEEKRKAVDKENMLKVLDGLNSHDLYLMADMIKVIPCGTIKESYMLKNPSDSNTGEKLEHMVKETADLISKRSWSN